MDRASKAVSKINLSLRIVGRRQDGYHDIETLFIPLDSPCDQLRVASAGTEGITMECSCPEIPSDRRNLCWRAAEKFAEFAGIIPGWKIHLEKKIPVAAGLGGGSSDAAAVLRLLQMEYPSVSDEALLGIASELGADVPFFLNPRPSIGRGKGEILSPVKLAGGLHFVLVNPGFPVSSGWGYRNYISKGSKCPDMTELCGCLESGSLDRLQSMLYNDLSPALFRKFPLLEMLRESMLKAGALAVDISGSGPTLFAPVVSRTEADNICRKISAEYGQVVTCFSSSAITS